ncbi:MAG: hypothetical protein R3F53_01140 [Gammaproteobacteria bacterium]
MPRHWLTFGVYTRIDSTMRYIYQRLPVGNTLRLSLEDALFVCSPTLIPYAPAPSDNMRKRFCNMTVTPARSAAAQANPQANSSVRPGVLCTTAVNVNYPKGGEITK